tara:strand:- start:169 stop:282 length:114 start_codon:yes stop_codon:yes gene_type:complete
MISESAVQRYLLGWLVDAAVPLILGYGGTGHVLKSQA